MMSVCQESGGGIGGGAALRLHQCVKPDVHSGVVLLSHLAFVWGWLVLRRQGTAGSGRATLLRSAQARLSVVIGAMGLLSFVYHVCDEGFACALSLTLPTLHYIDLASTFVAINVAVYDLVIGPTLSAQDHHREPVGSGRRGGFILVTTWVVLVALWVDRTSPAVNGLCYGVPIVSVGALFLWRRRCNGLVRARRDGVESEDRTRLAAGSETSGLCTLPGYPAAAALTRAAALGSVGMICFLAANFLPAGRIDDDRDGTPENAYYFLFHSAWHICAVGAYVSACGVTSGLWP